MNLDDILSSLESPIVVRPIRRMTQGELESYLDTAANILRGNSSTVASAIGRPKKSPISCPVRRSGSMW